MSDCDAPGCMLILVDESAGMNILMGETVSDGSATTKTNLERVATAVNSLLNQLAAGNDFDIAIVGYKTDGAGQPQIGSRWDGALAGRDWVSARELAGAPLRVETRSRKIPAANGFGVAREEQVSFPVWYSPGAGVKAPQIAAYNFCVEQLSQRQATSGRAAAPVVIHISAGASADGNPTMAVRKLLELGKGDREVPLVFQAHLATNATLTSSLFASNVMLLTSPSARDLFQRSSPLPDALVKQLKSQKIIVNAGARAMIHNAKIGDLIRFLGLVRQHVQSWPARPVTVASATTAAEPSPSLDVPSAAALEPPVTALPTAEDLVEVPPSNPGSLEVSDPSRLLVVVLDRSVQDPYGGDTANACVRLQDLANDMLKQVTRAKCDKLDVAIVSYGVDSAGVPDIRNAFDGPLAPRSVVSREDLADGAIRVEEYEEELSNGVGGLIKIKRKKAIYFELEPTSAGGVSEGFEAVAGIMRAWRGDHPGASTTIVLHFTRGNFTSDAIEAAFQAVTAENGALYHLVATEQPHDSVAYPETDQPLVNDELKHLWRCATPLLAIEKLSPSRPSLVADSRGLVVNGKFDILLDSLEAVCQGANQ